MVGLNRIPIGSMDRRIQILSRSTSKNAFNEDVATFAVIATVWGQKVELAGAESLAAQQVSSQKTTKFRIYYRSDVLATSRLVVDGLTHEITYIAELGRRDFLEITARTIAP